ncbi:MAG TPA: hypothetical protein PLR74_04245, partial [Agriterribacter sp.]|nr:hypothetical protein [Agriterribacter sp.]
DMIRLSRKTVISRPPEGIIRAGSAREDAAAAKKNTLRTLRGTTSFLFIKSEQLWVMVKQY